MSEPCYVDIPQTADELIALFAGNAPLRILTAIEAGAISTPLVGSAIYDVTLDADITDWTAPLPSGGNAATHAFYTTVDFYPPDSGTFSVTIPSAWKQAGPLNAISLAAGGEPIRVLLATIGTAVSYSAVQMV